MKVKTNIHCTTCKYEDLPGYAEPCNTCDNNFSKYKLRPINVDEDIKYKATRYNEGKPRLGLIPPEIIIGIGEVLTFGAQKYGDDNWKKGLSDENCMSSCLRHIMKYQGGEIYDEESGLHHLKHAACNIAFMLYFHEKK